MQGSVSENVRTVMFDEYPHTSWEIVAVENPDNVDVMVGDHIDWLRRRDEFARAWNVSGRFDREYRLLQVLRTDRSARPFSSVQVTSLLTARELTMLVTVLSPVSHLTDERIDRVPRHHVVVSELPRDMAVEEALSALRNHPGFRHERGGGIIEQAGERLTATC